MSNCSICQRPDHEQIDAEIVAGRSVRAVAAAFGVPKSTIGLHKTRCLVATLAEAAARRHGDELLDQLDFLVETSLGVVARAEARKKDALLLKAVSATCDVLKLKASLTGMKPEPAPRVSYSIVFDGGRARAVPAVIDAAPALTEGSDAV